MTVCSGIREDHVHIWTCLFSSLCGVSVWAFCLCFCGIWGVLVNECCMVMGNWVLKLDRISQNWSSYGEDISLGGDLPNGFRPHLKDDVGQRWPGVCSGREVSDGVLSFSPVLWLTFPVTHSVMPTLFILSETEKCMNDCLLRSLCLTSLPALPLADLLPGNVLS